ncbi:MAG: molybdate ABC transporter substrate-binding protein [Saprospiraceae bacterium]|nr:molybdate ABC transporter substrate-binding protein [Saprospiraceae bacterium]
MNWKRLLYFTFYILHFAVFTLTFTNCNKKRDTNEKLLIAVAANAQFAMEEIEQSFEEETGIQVEQVISSSGKLTAQIMQSAPYDIFISADMKYPNTLFQNGFTTAPPRVYAYGTLVLWTMRDFDLNNWQELLTQDSIQKIAIANPISAPYGLQALNLLKYYNLYETVQSKLVFGESIAQTNQYIASGACELGFTAKSIVLAPEIQGKGKWIEMDTAAYQPIEQGVVITKYGKMQHLSVSQRFFEYLFSEKGRAIFSKYGYQLPEISSSVQ